MFNIFDALRILFWPAVALIAVVVIWVLIEFFFGKKEKDLSVFEKRFYLFDTTTEYELFKILNELFADRYYIFPQVGYSHIIQVRKGLPEKERFGYWNSINRKTADLVLCDKDKVVPQLVIELDGSSHELPTRMERDVFINKLMGITGLSILHLKTTNLDKDFVRGEVERSLNSKVA